MKRFQFTLTKIMILLLSPAFAWAESVPVGNHVGNPLNYVLFNDKEADEEVDWVGDAIVEGGFYASGNIYMEYDYFTANVENGLEFDQWGTLYFFPEEEEGLNIPSFEQYDADLDVAYDFDGPYVNYLITSDSSLDTSYFFAKWDIYVIENGSYSEVPLPAGIWLFGSALLALAGCARRA